MILPPILKEAYKRSIQLSRLLSARKRCPVHPCNIVIADVHGMYDDIGIRNSRLREKIL